MTRDKDLIDSRDLITELHELEDRLDPDLDDPLDEDETERLTALRSLADEGIEDWEYGATLIHENYFVTYAQQLAEDIGAIDPQAQWPLSYIDWEAAAEALKMDYSVVTFQGDDYYVR